MAAIQPRNIIFNQDTKALKILPIKALNDRELIRLLMTDSQWNS